MSVNLKKIILSSTLIDRCITSRCIQITNKMKMLLKILLAGILQLGKLTDSFDLLFIIQNPKYLIKFLEIIQHHN